MRRRPLRRLRRAERRVAAILRGGISEHRSRRPRRPQSSECRRESRLQQLLRGWSQQKGGGWSIRAASWRSPIAPDLLPTLAKWTLACLGLLLLTLVLPKSVALIFCGLFGVVWAMPNRGASDKDPNADDGRVLLGKINKNYARIAFTAGMLTAAWFAVDPDTGQDRGLTKEQIITAAYNDGAYGAIANGDTALWLNNSLLSGGFDITQTPAAANPQIHLFREGGPSADHLYDLKAYGAAFNNSRDDYNNQQVAADAAAASADVSGTRVLWVDGGISRTSRPVWIKKSGIQVQGPGTGINTHFLGLSAGAGSLMATHQGGPLLMVGDASMSFAHLVPGLTTAGGNAVQWTDETHWLNIRELKNGDLNGKTALTVRAFYNSTANFSGCCIMASRGLWMPSDTISGAFHLYSANGVATFGINLSTSGLKTVTGGTLNDGVTHFVEGNYDGSMVRIFVDGTLKASTAGTGTVVQGIEEGVFLGVPASGGLPEQTLDSFFASPRGTVDSPEIADIARNTISYTPPTGRLPVDSHTLFTTDFSTFIGPAMQVSTTSGATGWLVQRNNNRNTSLYGFGISGVVLDSLTVGAATLLELLDNCEFWNVEHTAFQEHRVGLSALHKNKFQWSIRHATFHSGPGFGARFGIAMGVGAGIGQMDDVWFWGNPIPIIANSGIQLTNVFFQMAADSQSGPCFFQQSTSSAPATLTGCDANTESGVAANFRATLMVAAGLHASGVKLDGGVWESASGKPHMLVNGPIDVVRATGTTFTTIGTPFGSIMHHQGTVGRPCLFDQCPQIGAWQPWSDVAGSAIVGKIGPKTVTFSATLAFDCSLGDDFSLSTTVTAQITTTTVQNLTPGQEITWLFVQDGTGHTVAAPSQWKGASWVVDTTPAHWTLIKAKVANDLSLYPISVLSGA